MHCLRAHLLCFSPDFALTEVVSYSGNRSIISSNLLAKCLPCILSAIQSSLGLASDCSRVRFHMSVELKEMLGYKSVAVFEKTQQHQRKFQDNGFNFWWNVTLYPSWNRQLAIWPRFGFGRSINGVLISTCHVFTAKLSTRTTWLACVMQVKLTTARFQPFF